MGLITKIIYLVVLVIAILLSFYIGVYYQYYSDEFKIDYVLEDSVGFTYNTIFENCMNWFCEDKDCNDYNKNFSYEIACTELMTGEKVLD